MQESQKNPYNLWMVEQLCTNKVHLRNVCNYTPHIHSRGCQRWQTSWEMTNAVPWALAWRKELVTLRKEHLFSLATRQTHRHIVDSLPRKPEQWRKQWPENSTLRVQLWVIWVLECRESKREQAKEKGDKGWVWEREIKDGKKGALIKQTPLIPQCQKRGLGTTLQKCLFFSPSLSHTKHTHMYMLTELKLLAASTQCLTSNTGKKIYSASFWSLSFPLKPAHINSSTSSRSLLFPLSHLSLPFHLPPA